MTVANFTEVWKSIPGYEGYYEASSLGRIRGLMCSLGGRIRVAAPRAKPRELKQFLDLKRGYVKVRLYKSNVGRTISVHRLVLMAFSGVVLVGMDAAHADGNRTNNVSDNLSWLSRKDNERDKERHGTKLRGSRHGNSKLTEAQVLEIRALVASGQIQKAIAAQFGVAKSTVSGIATGHRWGHLR